MRFRFLFVVLGLSTFLFAGSLMGKKSDSSAKLSLRQQVESEVQNLKRNLAASPDHTWKHLEKSKSQIASLRAQNPRQFEADEMFMDLLLASLHEIPVGSQFKKQDCGAYRLSMLAKFDPKAKDPSPALAQTLSVLLELCR